MKDEGQRKIRMIDRIRRCLPNCNGVYIESHIQSTPLLFTVDSGATRTIISKEVFDQISVEDQPKLRKTSSLKGAGGKLLKEYGEAKLKIQLGDIEFEKSVVVADIEDDGLLGSDVLLEDEYGPADIIASREVLVFRGTEIPVMIVGSSRKTRKVYVAEDIEIPAMSEAIVDTLVQSFRVDKLCDKNEVLIEPSQEFKTKYPLFMGSSIVDLKGSPVARVRVMNPYYQTIKLRSKAHIADAETFVEETGTVVDKETEVKNDCYIRRIQLPGPLEVTQNPSDVVFDKGQVCKTNVKLPPHLNDVYKKASEYLEMKEKAEVESMLASHQKAFCKDEFDLGRTHLVEHSIDTGDSRPIKLAPRRVPLAFQNEEKKAIEHMLKKKAIRESTSPWASSIVFVRKKNCKVRPYVDYRRLN